MTTETKPSEPAMRATNWIGNTGLPITRENWDKEVLRIANIIDRETQLPRILEVLEAIKVMGDHIDLMQGLPLKRIFAQTFEKLDALLVAYKPR